MMTRFHASGVELDFEKDEEHTELLEAFNDKSISHQNFLKMIQECKVEKELKKLRRSIMKS